MTSSDSSKMFHPEVESVEEFLERFELQNKSSLADEANKGMTAAILANSLPIAVLTDIQLLCHVSKSLMRALNPTRKF